MSSGRDARTRVELDITLGQEPLPARPRVESPFNIAVLGDFRGAGSTSDYGDWQPILVDRDNVDEVMARLSPGLRFRMTSGEQASEQSVNEAQFALQFKELDDFHPDRLLQRVPALAAVWQLRQRLADTRTFAAAARELRGEEIAAPPPSGGSARAGGASLLEDILATQAGPALTPVAAPREDDLQTFIRRVVGPHLIAGQDPRQAALVAQVDEMLVNGLRSLLHQPAFQALESLWRGVDFLTRRLETDGSLRVHLVNVPRAVLAADVAAENERTKRFSRLVNTGVDDAPWAMLAGCYTFSPSAQDAALLGHIGQVAREAGVPFIAAAHLRLAGCPALDTFTEPAEWTEPVDPAWGAFRKTPEASHVALALPRVLLRPAYGDDGEPCELLPFEEATDSPAHEDFLWGNPALACALLLGHSFQRAGWQLRPGLDQNIEGLPLQLVRSAAGTYVLPCAEALMTERAAALLLERGLTPLASLKDQGAVRLIRFQSMASPATALAGGWNQLA
ncbi:MAG: type VI secretion system contractile sheath domain-containing protein [Longimicrobiales bacterium]